MTFKKGERPLGMEEEEMAKDLSGGTVGGRVGGLEASFRAGSMTGCI